MAEMKVDVVGLVKKLDPFHRDPNGMAVGVRSKVMSPMFASILEFLLSVTYRGATPPILSLVVTSDGHVIGNGNYLWTALDLQGNLRRWIDAIGGLSVIEIKTFQIMLDDTIGYSHYDRRITV